MLGTEAHAARPGVNGRRGSGNRGYELALLLRLRCAGRAATGRELERDLGPG